MTLIKKADVPAYRAARLSGKLHLVKTPVKAPEIQSPKNNRPVEANPATFVDDFSLDHSAPGGAVSSKVFPVTANESQTAKAPGIKHS